MKKISAICIVIVIAAVVLVHMDKTKIYNIYNKNGYCYCDEKNVAKCIHRTESKTEYIKPVSIDKIDVVEIEKEEKASTEFKNIERKEKNRMQQARRIVDENV